MRLKSFEEGFMGESLTVTETFTFPALSCAALGLGLDVKDEESYKVMSAFSISLGSIIH
jgi:hypothetical protein